MKVLILPLFAIILLGIASPLIQLAESSSQKTVSFATEMEHAMPCAARGIPLAQCSPDLTEYDFSEDLAQAQELNLQIIDQLRENYNITDDMILALEGRDDVEVIQSDELGDLIGQPNATIIVIYQN